jgi:DNA/RNA-binding domain of Phe-tRNA-synthetase-like protein
MHIQHSSDVWSAHPGLVAGVIFAASLPKDGELATPDGPVAAAVARYLAAAEQRLAGGAESDLPEIQAWRRTFARMGLKPTQYRCAAESLLRRYRKEREVPQLHPLINLCNAISMAYAIPVAALDTARVDGWLEVRPAAGTEEYLTFGGEVEHPDPGEVVFVDAEGRAHARRWTNRQSGYSAVRDTTTDVLIVAEAMHDTAATDIPALIDALAADLAAAGAAVGATAVLRRDCPRFDFTPG